MLDWYIVLFVYSNHPHTKMEKGMKDKEKKTLLDIKLTEEDIVRQHLTLYLPRLGSINTRNLANFDHDS